MIGIFQLKENYKEAAFVDFNKKRYLISFNIGAIVIALGLFYIFQIQTCPLFSLSGIIFAAIGLFAFIVIHELIHGLFIWIFSKKKAIYKFSFFYASAGASDRYFDKSAYIIIALSPVIIISIFLITLMNIVPTNLYNAILLVFAFNVSGAIGDFYITLITLFKPKDTFINDQGESMHFYTKLHN